jgi:copper chaperone
MGSFTLINMVVIALNIAINIQELKTMKLRIDAMTCGGCARSVTATIKDLDPNATVQIDVATKIVEIESTAPQQKILETLAEDGFPAVQVA